MGLALWVMAVTGVHGVCIEVNEELKACASKLAGAVGT